MVVAPAPPLNVAVHPEYVADLLVLYLGARQIYRNATFKEKLMCMVIRMMVRYVVLKKVRPKF